MTILADETLAELQGGLLPKLTDTPRSLLGTNAFRATLPIKRNHFRKALDGASFSVTVACRGIHFETYLCPLRGPDGVIHGVVALSLDVTKDLQLEQQLESERHAVLAAQRLNSLTCLAGGIAHELNNPVAIISGYAQRLLGLAQKGDVPKELLLPMTQKIIDSSQRCHEVVKSIRTFAGDVTQEEARFWPLNEMVEIVLGMFEQRFAERSVRLTWQPLPEAREVLIQRSALLQALYNVVLNALEAVAEQPEPAITVSGKMDGERLKLCIQDNGPGVPESLKNKIFEPFFSTKDQKRFVGIGLSTARGILEAAAGHIEFTSVPGDTRFWVTLPAAKEDVVSRAS